MAHPKLAGILETLLERTRRGEVAWEETSDEEQFAVALPEHSITILRRAGRFAFKYVLSVQERKGITLEKLDSEDDPAQHDALEQLFGSARPRALKVEENLDAVLEGLKKQGRIGGGRREERPYPF